VLAASLLGSGVALLAAPFVDSIPQLALVALLFAALYAGVSAMVFGLLALEAPAERRSTTLNLVYLPLYAAGIVGPAAAAVVVRLGVALPFIVGGIALLAIGAIVLVRLWTSARQAGRSRSLGPM
jgi:hypothetical protein